MNITARNTNALARKVYPLLSKMGHPVSSRNGDALRFPEVVTICILQPCERVNFSHARDANPFFHLMESMAMLTGFNSVPLLAYYAKNMANYSDDGKTFNAFYGTRMYREQQFLTVIENLRRNPDSRQELVVLWDIEDLTKTTKDKACNFAMLFEVFDRKLRMTTFNRSNDAIWGGVTGANIVHFSFFQEFVAAALGLPVGQWTHVSANLHVYVDNPKWASVLAEAEGPDFHLKALQYPGFTELGTLEAGMEFFDHEEFLHQLTDCVNHINDCVLEDKLLHENLWDQSFTFPFISTIVQPMALAWSCWKVKDIQTARQLLLDEMPPNNDWATAALLWLDRRS